ncbi:MAG: hypothetical protein UY44_C0002G0018 [Candidatus Kaiserbacteria bacterium GW2011_GWA2_49_19]|uniref:Uncharacterized protein n=1 Tax=Candidatus Kaiserbacteria bacterium GW2011_GWA2_49_19 TaxID=1618669 RepID=A0A0G1VS85_9BACT|nr:MAG: hypothetical protein UY44_C0002G0018 [Candidatus Kaiserbacteria bacterium GW2011_GWA2_49_19]
MNKITMDNFATIGEMPNRAGIASAQNYGKLSVWV